MLSDPGDIQCLGAIRSMISTDPPKHTKLRGVVNRGFMPALVRTLTPARIAAPPAAPANAPVVARHSAKRLTNGAAAMAGRATER